MSRTKHHGSWQCYGREFWGKRAGNRHGAPTGSVSKKITARKERMIDKELILREVNYCHSSEI